MWKELSIPNMKLTETEEQHILYITLLLDLHLAKIKNFGWLALYVQEKEQQWHYSAFRPPYIRNSDKIWNVSYYKL